MPNPIFRSRAVGNVKAALARAAEASKVEHTGLQGLICEIAVEELLRPFLPSRYAFATGKLVDCMGGLSRQVDLIAYDPQSLPGLMYSERDGLVPIESAFFTVEVKATLHKAGFTKTVADCESIAKLKTAWWRSANQKPSGEWYTTPSYVPNFLFAFKSEPEHTVRGWVDEAIKARPNRELPQICVPGIPFFAQDPDDSFKRVEHPTTDHYDEVLEFIARLDWSAWHVENHRRSAALVMGRYLSAVELPHEPFQVV